MKIVVQSLDDVARIIQRLQEQIDGLRSERRTAATTIGSGGSLVVDGGDVLLLDVDGSVMFRLGTQPLGDRGISISREDGSDAFTIAKRFAQSSQQEVRVYDRFGTELLAEEAIGRGISKPLLHIPMQPVQATASTLSSGPYGWEVPSASTSWTSVFQAWFPRHNQYGTFQTYVAASDTATAAEVRVINTRDGNHLGQLLQPPLTRTRAAGSTGYVGCRLDGLVMPEDPHVDMSIAIQVRRTAGTGTLRVALTESHGGS